MRFLTDMQYSITFDCPYIPERDARYRMFHAVDLSHEDLEEYLSRGFRKFGTFFFKPRCIGCRSCIPIRILTAEVAPSKSQRRALKKAHNVTVRFREPVYTEEIFDIYLDHSQRFSPQENSAEEFIATFYTPSCPALQSEYYLDGKLFAVGFIDVSSKAFSSVYFVYRQEYGYLSPGTISVFHECTEARRMGLAWYYLGYYVEENDSMNYKNRFLPHEMMDWKSRKWLRNCSVF
ncbi:MAG: arginyltransferase [Spirochaetota bacterium]